MNNEYVNGTASNPEQEARGNGPRPESTSGISREWLKRIDISAIVEHMDSDDIAELLKILPADVLERVDLSHIISHMDSDDIVSLVQSLPAEQLRKIDVAAVVENMDSDDILRFMKRLLS